MRIIPREGQWIEAIGGRIDQITTVTATKVITDTGHQVQIKKTSLGDLADIWKEIE